MSDLVDFIEFTDYWMIGIRLAAYSARKCNSFSKGLALSWKSKLSRNFTSPANIFRQIAIQSTKQKIIGSRNSCHDYRIVVFSYFLVNSIYVKKWQLPPPFEICLWQLTIEWRPTGQIHSDLAWHRLSLSKAHQGLWEYILFFSCTRQWRQRGKTIILCDESMLIFWWNIRWS